MVSAVIFKAAEVPETDGDAFTVLLRSTLELAAVIFIDEYDIYDNKKKEVSHIGNTSFFIISNFNFQDASMLGLFLPESLVPLCLNNC